MAKSKTTHVVVLLKSIITNHKIVMPRLKQADKLEVVKFDPYVRKDVLYREIKKIKSVSLDNRL